MTDTPSELRPEEAEWLSDFIGRTKWEFAWT